MRLPSSSKTGFPSIRNSSFSPSCSAGAAAFFFSSYSPSTPVSLPGSCLHALTSAHKCHLLLARKSIPDANINHAHKTVTELEPSRTHRQSNDEGKTALIRSVSTGEKMLGVPLGQRVQQEAAS